MRGDVSFAQGSRIDQATRLQTLRNRYASCAFPAHTPVVHINADQSIMQVQGAIWHAVAPLFGFPLEKEIVACQ